jgi:hypothetical protein
MAYRSSRQHAATVTEAGYPNNRSDVRTTVTVTHAVFGCRRLLLPQTVGSEVELNLKKWPA